MIKKCNIIGDQDTLNLIRYMIEVQNLDYKLMEI